MTNSLSNAAPQFSLIVPVYGVEEFVGECMDSIISAAHFLDQCELIVVDDGSTDNSMAIVEQRCANLPNVTVIRQANGGLSAARNAGLAAARGDYIWFIDSDDEIFGDALTILSHCIEQFAPDIVAFEFETRGGSLDRRKYLPIFDKPVDPIEFLISGRPPSPVQFYLFSRALLERAALRFHNGIYHEDALFTPSAMTAAATLVRLKQVCYRYRLRPGSIMSVARPEKHLADMLFVAESLGAAAASHPKGSSRRKALSREVGFALAAARYYAVRTMPEARRAIAPLTRLLRASKSRLQHFSSRELITYLRMLAFTVATNRLGRHGS